MTTDMNKIQKKNCKLYLYYFKTISSFNKEDWKNLNT